MKFYDRKKEMAILYAAKEQSQTSACFTVMTGRRRIGKTALLLESVKENQILGCQRLILHNAVETIHFNVLF